MLKYNIEHLNIPVQGKERKDLLPSNPPFTPRLLESSLPARRASTLEAISSFEPLLARICSIRAFASGVTATRIKLISLQRKRKLISGGSETHLCLMDSRYKGKQKDTRLKDKQDVGGGNLRSGTSIFGLFLCLRIARSNAFSISFAFSTDSSAVLKLTAPPTLQRVSVGNSLLSRERGAGRSYIGCTELKYNAGARSKSAR